MGRLYGLDALRGIAALFVALMHLQFIYGDEGRLRGGFLMVDFFFMLSGYVMARTYEGRLRDGMNGFGFLRLRFKRLWPAVSVGVIIGLGWRLLVGEPLQGNAVPFFMALLLLPDISRQPGSFVMNGPAWSITFELFANLLHGALLWHLRVRWLLAIALCSASVLPLTSINLQGGQHQFFFWGLPRVLVTYPLGIALWRVVRDRAILPFWLAGVLPIAALLYGWGDPEEMHKLDIPFAVIICPLALVAGLGMSKSSRLVPLASFLGALSFPLYAVHWPIFEAVNLLEGPKILAAGLALVLAVLIAWRIERTIFLGSARTGRQTPHLA